MAFKWKKMTTKLGDGNRCLLIPSSKLPLPNGFGKIRSENILSTPL